jgi:hypothetical protein
MPDDTTHQRVTRPTGETLAGGAVLLVVAASVAGWQWAMVRDLTGGREAVAFAIAATLPGALLGWILARLPFSSAAMGAASGLAGILLRLALPLGCLAWLTTRPVEPDAVRPAGLLVAAYLALLATDVGMHVGLRKTGLRHASDPLSAGRSRVAD